MSITNFSDDPLGNFAKSVMLGSSAMIEQQEAAGQQELVNSTMLPIKGDWKALEQLGIRKVAGSESDLFCEAILPEGWSKKATDHSMWSNLIDDRGLRRISIFYKAAFYDRDAFFNITQNRFVVQKDYDYLDSTGHLRYRVFDGGLDRVVKLCTPGYFGVCNSKIYFEHDGVFYWNAVKTKSHDCKFLDSSRDRPDGFTRLKLIEIRQRFQEDSSSVWMAKDAADSVSKLEATKFIDEIPLDRQWESEFDFPAIA